MRPGPMETAGTWDRATLPGTELQMGKVVPGTPMIDAASGARASLWDLRQRFSSAVCFLHVGCKPCALYARKLRVLAGELRELDAVAVIVVPEAADIEPPVWIDRDGRARERFVGPETGVPLILIVDRYGAAAGAFPSQDHAFPPPEEVVATLRHLAMQCPECGVSEW